MSGVDFVTCDACGGRGDFEVIHVEFVATSDGGHGGQYAYPRSVPCGRCLGRGAIEEAS